MLTIVRSYIPLNATSYSLISFAANLTRPDSYDYGVISIKKTSDSNDSPFLIR